MSRSMAYTKSKVNKAQNAGGWAHNPRPHFKRGTKMKRLYHCNATIDNSGLVSYTTRTIAISAKSINMHMIHTHTTMSHVRKYARYLAEMGNDKLANTILAMYHLAIAKHAEDVIYNGVTGEIFVPFAQ